MSRRARSWSLALAILASAGRAEADRIGAVELSTAAEVETGSIALGATVVAAWAAPADSGAERALWLLLREPEKSGGGRSLARLSFAEGARIETVATGLAPWMDRLAAVDLGLGPELVGGGDGHLAALGVSLAKGAADSSGPTARALLEDPAFDLAAIATSPLDSSVLTRLHAAEPGRIRIWEGDGAGALRETAAVRIPFAVTRTAAGLRRSNPDLLPLTGRNPDGAGSTVLFLGPEALGHLRLRGEWIDLAAPAAPRRELWAALPAPESVDRAWPARIGSTSILIVRAQAADAMNIFEAQRLRVLPLAEDRTRAGARPTLEVELDSKRWHTTSVTLADVDGDGDDDLLAVFPEGLSGKDLVAQWWPGSGDGRFEKAARRSDLDGAGESWLLVPPGGSASPAAVLVVRDRYVELRPFAASGKRALAPEPALAMAFRPPAKEARKKKTITVGSGEESVELDSEGEEVELLGAVDLDGRPGAEILALVPDGPGRHRLLFARKLP